MTIGFESFIDKLIDEIDGGTVDKGVSKTEEEQAFYILSDNPKKVLQDLCEFEKLSAGYFLDPGHLLHITDTFYDTPDGVIKSGKSSLRVREVDGKPFVTIKGKNTSTDASSKRSELEVAWPWGEPTPHMVAELFGMEKIQIRNTERIARPVIRKYDKRLMAELAIDKVDYGFVKVFEVEIEMKSDKGAPLWQMRQDLEKKFPELRRWSSSKFAMGSILEQVLAIKTDKMGFLTPESFKALSTLKVV